MLCVLARKTGICLNVDVSCGGNVNLFFPRQLLLVSRRGTQRASQPANTAFARWGRGRYAAAASGQFRSAVHGYQGNDC